MWTRPIGRRGTKYRIAVNSPHNPTSPASSQNIRRGYTTVSNQSDTIEINRKFECRQCRFYSCESSSVAEVRLPTQSDKLAQFYRTFLVFS
uniref:Nuclear receptor domain-containing protein n=1 Tax=Caenorhabditis tropicalis TaxID=1561998 RepID=A0A1I7TNE6_9PELO